jgi:hypothetical protein
VKLPATPVLWPLTWFREALETLASYIKTAIAKARRPRERT